MLTIRAMTRDELELGVDWAAREGWNPGLHDAAVFHAADPEGFLGGWLDGRLVAMISAVRYGAGFGFIGFYLVDPAFRGQGHGLAVWQAGMARLAGRLVGLDGVVAQQANYRRSGFELAWNNVRYQGRVSPLTALASPAGALAVARPHAASDVAGLSCADALGTQAARHRVVRGDEVPLSALLEHDQAFFPDDRRSFMGAWLTQPGATLRVVVREAMGEEGYRVAGLALARPCRSGFKIGPLWADAPDLARPLLASLAAELPQDAPVQWDIPAPNTDAVALAESCGMAPVFETARMYTGPSPTMPMARMFGITSFELG